MSALINPHTGKTVENVAVYGYRWFQKTYGNTYHTFIVFVDGIELVRSETYEYGYGNQFEWSAFREFLKAFEIEGDYVPWSFFRDRDIVYTVGVSDGLKRDLMQFAPFGPADN